MKHLQQKQTRFDAHGHWNTVHDAEITLNDAILIIDVIAAKYPDAFTYSGGKWRLGNAIPEKLPYSLRDIVDTLMIIIDSDP